MVPDVYFFNPTCDFALANGSVSWQPNQLLKQMESDLGTLPMFLATEHDIVLVNKLPTVGFLENIRQTGRLVPQFLEIKTIRNSNKLNRININRLLPWGWSPSAHHTLKLLKDFCSGEFRQSVNYYWKPAYRKLASRENARDWLIKILHENTNAAFIGSNHLPEICNSIEDIELSGKKWGKVLVKLPWSSSGRGLQLVSQFPVHQSVKQRLNGMFKDQHFVIAEPFLNKVADMGFLYNVQGENVELKGFSHFFTNEKGRYAGNYLNGFQENMDPELVNFVESIKIVLPGIHTKMISRMKVSEIYEGPFGIDTLIYRDTKGDLKINPCLEINWRFTMGFIALALEKMISPYSRGVFQIISNSQSELPLIAKRMQQQSPLIIENGMIKSGFLPLTEYAEDNLFGASLLVDSQSLMIKSLG